MIVETGDKKYNSKCVMDSTMLVKRNFLDRDRFNID